MIFCVHDEICAIPKDTARRRSWPQFIKTDKYNWNYCLSQIISRRDVDTNETKLLYVRLSAAGGTYSIPTYLYLDRGKSTSGK